MLQLRPNCEYCDKDLPPGSTEARICSYECTFCATCVETVLHDVCPNCVGGFVPQPMRPATERRPGLCLAKPPAPTERRHLPKEKPDPAEFARAARGHRPEER